MTEQVDIKRQVRYKDSIYDILKDITLGNYNYLIIGKGSDSKFYDIDFVEQRIEDGKIKYISPVSNYRFNIDSIDFSRIQGQSLMNYIVNEIKDNINQGLLTSSTDTINYIDEVAKVIDANNDIKGFFKNNSFYDSEDKLDESIKTLIGYYQQDIKDYVANNKLPMGEVVVSDDTVEEIYSELENTQNFGVSAIYDYENKKNEKATIDYNNRIFADISTSSNEEEQINSNESMIFSQTEITKDNIDSNINVSFKENNDITTEQVDSNSNLSFQERLYLENEKRMQEKQRIDFQTNLSAKTKTLTLNNNSLNNSAYVTISFFLYLIGSFELLLAVIMLAKFL